MQILGTVEWRNRTLSVARTCYTDKWRRPALVLLLTKTIDGKDEPPWDHEWEGDQFATASVNLADEPKLDPNEVFIKNWMENEGILEALVEAGIIKDTGHTIPTGHVFANVCTIIAGIDDD